MAVVKLLQHNRPESFRVQGGIYRLRTEVRLQNDVNMQIYGQFCAVRDVIRQLAEHLELINMADLKSAFL